MKKLLYISLPPHGSNDFFDSFKKYFDCQLYTGVWDAIRFQPDIIHIHAGALNYFDALEIKKETNATWTQFTGDCDFNPLEPVNRLKDLCDITMLTANTGVYSDHKRVEWMPEAVTYKQCIEPKSLTDGKIVFVGNYYDHMPDGPARREVCQFLSKEYPENFECYGNFHVPGVNCMGTIQYDRVAALYNNAYIVIAHDNNSSVTRYFTQRYLGAMATSCCVGKQYAGSGIDFEDKPFIPYNNLLDLKTSIDFLFKRPNKRNDLAQKSHKEIKARFTYDKWVERYINLIG